MELRDYQATSVDALSARLATKVTDDPVVGTRKRRVCVVAPTGAGKTIIAVAIILRLLARSRRVLFLAHRRELLEQCYKKLLSFGLTIAQLSLLRADDPRRNDGAPVVVGSLQTINARKMLIPADVVFLDEAHGCAAPSVEELLARYPDAWIIGLTATPVRGNRGLGSHFDELLLVAAPSELIAHGHIIKPEIFTVPDHLIPETAKVKTVRSASGDVDYDPRALAEACERRELIGPIVEHWQRHGRGAPTVAFCASIKSSHMLVEAFREKGIAAAHLDGDTPDGERAAVYEQLASGAITVLSNANVLIEGWDAPHVRTCIMARPTKSLVVYLQQVGRIVRPYGDMPCTLLDHAGNVQAHGYPYQDFAWDLNKAPRKQAQSLKACPVCYHPNPTLARVCENPTGDCGPPPYTWTKEEVERSERELIVAAGRLERVVDAPVDDDKYRTAWNQWCRQAITEEKAEDWARMQFKKAFGAWPEPASYKFPPRPQAAWDDVRRRRKLGQLYARSNRVAVADKQAWVEGKYQTLFGEPTTQLVAREHARARTALAKPAANDCPANDRAQTELKL